MDIISKDAGDHSRLYGLLERIEGHFDSLKSELEDVKAGRSTADTSIEQLRQSVAAMGEIKERLDNMDKLLPRGSKRYIPVVGEDLSTYRTEVRAEFGRWLINGAATAVGAEKRWGGGEIAQQYTADGDGGYLVPDLFMQEIQIIREMYGFVRKNFRIIPVPTEVKHVPIYGTGPAVEWVDEGDTTSANTKVTFTRKSLSTKRLMAIELLSWEIMEWSDPSIIQFIVDLTGEKLAKEEDRVGLKGDTGAGDPFNGAITVAGNTYAHPTAGENDFTDITYEDLINTQDAVNEFVAGTSKWVMSNHVRNVIRMIRAGGAVTTSTANDQVGFPMWAVGMTSDAPNTLLGSPLDVSAVMPKSGDDGGVSDPVLLFGDFRRAMALADGKQVSVKFSEHYDFKRANVVMRTMETVGFKELLPDALALLTVAAA